MSCVYVCVCVCVCVSECVYVYMGVSKRRYLRLIGLEPALLKCLNTDRLALVDFSVVVVDVALGGVHQRGAGLHLHAHLLECAPRGHELLVDRRTLGAHKSVKSGALTNWSEIRRPGLSSGAVWEAAAAATGGRESSLGLSARG